MLIGRALCHDSSHKPITCGREGLGYCDWPGDITWALFGVCKITFAQMPGNRYIFGPQRKDAEQHTTIVPHGLVEMSWGKVGCGEPLAQREQWHQGMVRLEVGNLYDVSSYLACVDLALDIE